MRKVHVILDPPSYLLTTLSSTFNTVPAVKRTGVVVSYWLIDIALTYQRSCISREVHYVP